MNKLFLIIIVLNFSCINASDNLQKLDIEFMNCEDFAKSTKAYYHKRKNDKIYSLDNEEVKLSNQLYTGMIDKNNFDNVKQNIPNIFIHQLLNDDYKLKFSVDHTNAFANVFVSIFENEMKLVTYPINIENNIGKNYCGSQTAFFDKISKNKKFTSAENINEYSGAIFTRRTENHTKLVELTKKLLGIHPDKSKNVKFSKIIREIKPRKSTNNTDNIVRRLIGQNIEENIRENIVENKIKFNVLTFYTEQYNLFEFPLLTINDKNDENDKDNKNNNDNFKKEINDSIDVILNTSEGIKLFYELISLAMLGYNSKTIEICNGTESKTSCGNISILSNKQTQCLKYDRNGNYIGPDDFSYDFCNTSLFHEINHLIQDP